MFIIVLFIKQKYQFFWLYINTLRYLKLRQIWGRITNYLPKPKPDLRAAPPVRPITGRWTNSVYKRTSMLSPSKFIFLNAEHEILTSSDWNFRCLPKLWLYNLHYFDDLNSQQTPVRNDWHRNLLERWIKENPPGTGCGWEAYPISIRAVNWIKYFIVGNTKNDEILKSLTIQIRYLTKRLEWHLLGNHLFANAKALVFVGSYFHGNEAQSWLQVGMGILEREIPEQILSDGGHFERSPMYHALALEDLLDLLNLANTYPDTFLRWQSVVESWSQIIKKMGAWLMTMSHPDGQISFFNDSATGIAPSPASLYLYCNRLGIQLDIGKNVVEHLIDSGYIRVEIGSAVLLIDVARIGPDYLPGHAHADTLSYEISLNGRRIIVNSGTSRYGLGPEREWERSTAAHNTVEIDGQSSSEVWGGFRVARRAYPVDVSVRRDGSSVIVEAAHDGFKRLSGKPAHSRRWTIDENRLEVYDKIEGRFSQAISRVYLHPEINLEFNANAGKIYNLDREIVWQSTFTDIAIEETVWHQEFGVSIPNKCIKMTLSSPKKFIAGSFTIIWS